MKGRIVRSRLQYIRTIVQGDRALLGWTWEEMRRGRGEMIESIRNYCRWVGIEEEELEVISKRELKGKIAEVQDRLWREELGRKSTLELYRTWKTEMRQEDCYDGRPESTVWFRARTNSLMLGDRNRHLGQGTECFMCGHETEDLRHFVLDCEHLENIRGTLTGLQRPRMEDWKEVLGEFLYGEGRTSNRGELYRLWRE